MFQIRQLNQIMLEKIYTNYHNAYTHDKYQKLFPAPDLEIVRYKNPHPANLKDDEQAPPKNLLGICS